MTSIELPARLAEAESPGAAEALRAFESLFRQSYSEIVRCAFRVTGTRHEAEEIAAEAFTKFYRDRPAVQNPVAWIKRCALRGALDALRASQRRARREQTVSTPATRPLSPDTLFEQSEQRVKVRRILAEMRQRDAEMLLARADGSSYQEIAELLGINAVSVGKLLERAEANFRKRYEQRYGIQSTIR